MAASDQISKMNLSQRQRRVVKIDRINLGGIADSIYAGKTGSVAALVGLDVHSIPGLTQANQRFTICSGAPTDDFYKIVPCSDGNIYYFGKVLGNVWKEDSGGSFTNLGTVSPAAGNIGVLDAMEYNGYIYYSMQSRLGRWDFTAAFSGRNDNFATFTNANATYHPMTIQNIVLYIGDGNFVSQYDSSGAGAFTANALTLESFNQVSALAPQGTDLLIGTTIKNKVNKTRVFRWNTWGVSFTDSNYIDECGINAFILTPSMVRVSAGLNGRIYELDSNDILHPIKQVIGTYSPTQTCIVNYPAVSNKFGIPIFGMSNVLGNPNTQGIYGFGARDESYPTILTVENPISTNNLSNIVIWSIAVVGNDIRVSWQDKTSGTVYGIDKFDWSNKVNGGYLESRVIKYSDLLMDVFEEFDLNYGNGAIASGCSFTVSYKLNGAAYVAFTSGETIVDTIRALVNVMRRIDAKTLQIKIVFNTSGNNTPTLEDVVIPVS